MTTDLVVGEAIYSRLTDHLFQPDRDEHAAVLLAGVHELDGRRRLLARELHLVPAKHFLPGEQGYRQTSPRFVAEIALRASSEKLAYVAIHSHPGARREVHLSGDDLEAHRRLFPHLLNLTEGYPVAGIALGLENSAGEIWAKDGPPQAIREVRVVGHNIDRLAPSARVGAAVDPRFDRQARLFGAAGQEILRSLRISVIGAGGGGSMLVEHLAHLGVGAITVVDFDVVKDINLSRIVGSTVADVGTKKVDVLRRLAARIDPTIQFTAIDGDIVELPTAERLLDSDFIFLATDTIASRLVFNAIAHRYLIPGVQIGAKVDVGGDGRISQVYVAVRPVLPDRGCLQCNGLIDPMQLQREARTKEERQAQNYMNEPEVVDPSVISLNGLAVSHAVNVMLFAVTGLAEPAVFDHRLFLPRSGDVLAVRDKKLQGCPFCSQSVDSSYASGGPSSALPCRRVISSAPSAEPASSSVLRPPSRIRGIAVRLGWRSRVR